MMKTLIPDYFASRLLFVLLASGLAAPAMAQQMSGAEGLLNDKWVFNLGGFFFATDTKAGLNGQSSTNPDIDFDNELGKPDDSRRIRADALWRITPEHHVRFMYFNNSVDRSRALSRDVHWGDYNFQTGSNLQLSQKTQVFELAYEYAFLRRPTYEVAANIGVHYMETKLKLSGTATFTNPSGVTTVASATTKESSLPAPLPVIGIRGGWVVGRDWLLEAQGQVFKLKVGDYDGNWTDLRASATWMFSRNFGVGLGYDRFTTKVDVSKNDFNGRLKTGYSGYQAFLTGTF
jgi:hypothetical protein